MNKDDIFQPEDVFAVKSEDIFEIKQEEPRILIDLEKATALTQEYMQPCISCVWYDGEDEDKILCGNAHKAAEIDSVINSGRLRGEFRESGNIEILEPSAHLDGCRFFVLLA